MLLLIVNGLFISLVTFLSDDMGGISMVASPTDDMGGISTVTHR